MGDYCTCGAQLPVDARFCHKCGKPQFEMTAPPADEPAAPAAPLPEQPAGPPEISFHNRAAVRTGMVTAFIASLLISLPMPVYVAVFWLLLWLVAAGFVAVYIYHRRTRQSLTVRAGARMGWITGLFCFLIAMVVFTLSVLDISRRGGLAAFYKQQMSGRPGADVNLQEALRLLENPVGLGVMLLFTLILLFLMFTGLPTIGGALCAKVLEKER